VGDELQNIAWNNRSYMVYYS